MLAIGYDVFVTRGGPPAMAKHRELARPMEPDEILGGEGDESQLVDAVIRGDERAARTIWVRYAPMVYGVVRRTLGPEGDSDDAAQEIFMRLFAGLHKLQDRTALRSFLYSIAIRVLKWKLRRRWVRRIMTLTETGAVPDAPVTSVPAETREAVTRLYRILDRLKADDRTFFVLRNIEHLTVEEIAKATALSPSTVKRRIQQASKRADELLQGDPVLSTYLSTEHEEP
jgi:RNA polymerase sigma-70 factor (ECF subfamily)